MTATLPAAQLRIDWTRCDGHGLCRELLPDRIQLDEWGFPILVDTAVDPTDETAVRRAIGVCPALALRLDTPAPATHPKPARR